MTTATMNPAWRRTGFLAVTVFVFFAAASHAAEQESGNLKELGIEYELKEFNNPRPNRVHVLQLDFALEKIKPAVVIGKDPDGDGPAEAVLTSPVALARDLDIVAFVNSNPWNSFPNQNGKRSRYWFPGQPVDIFGLAVTNGQVRSRSQKNFASAWFSRDGQLHLGQIPASGKGRKIVREGVSGFQAIVKAGKVVPQPEGAIHPRTAIGVDQSGRTVWLVVVDGRQNHFSEGMNLPELSRLMQSLGCWGAINMDGGGSSVMGLVNGEGKLHVINNPSDHVLGIHLIRPLPVLLTIQKTGK